MGQICPACNKAELKDLVPGIQQCPACRKIFKDLVKSEEKTEEKGDVLDGNIFMKETSLNPKWEVADKGITISREKNKTWFAVLMCHSPSFPNSKYIRISWWKNSINAHAGMFKIVELDELDNVIFALEQIDKNFDENFQFTGEINGSPIPGREEFDETELFNEKTRLCPKCGPLGYKMKKSKNKRYYECERCGEIIVLYEAKPIYNIPNKQIPLNFSSNFPVNYYLPYYGITVKQLMGEWKAIVAIYPQENPDKKWLRFYWWRRDLQEYISSQYSFGAGRGLKWEPRKGTLSPNIYEKSQIKKLVEGLKKLREIWVEYLPKVEKTADEIAIENKTNSDKEGKSKRTKKTTKKKSTKKTTKKKSSKKTTKKKSSTKTTKKKSS